MSKKLGKIKGITKLPKLKKIPKLKAHHQLKPTASMLKVRRGKKLTSPHISSVASHLYDPAKQILSVTFLGSGKTYAYLGVPPGIADQFAASSSKGSFLHSSIINQFDGQLIKSQFS